jgi:hypothetical protein
VPPNSVQNALDVAALLELSAERDLWRAYADTAWRDGYRAGRADAAAEFSHGYAAAVADVKAAEHALPGYLRGQREIEERRWILRGEDRARGTFADPHPADFPGRGRDAA